MCTCAEPNHVFWYEPCAAALSPFTVALLLHVTVLRLSCWSSQLVDNHNAHVCQLLLGRCGASQSSLGGTAGQQRSSVEMSE